ncbi:hypothetical protein BD769DRAFT_1398481, partial [Suillus cothurnatus]
MMHGMDNSEDFWEDVYEHPMADFLRQYEQWACTQNQNLNEHDSLEAVRKQVCKIFPAGPSCCDRQKRYHDELHNIHKLRDALKARTCYWAVLSHQREVQGLMHPNLIRTVQPGRLFESHKKNDQMQEYLRSEKGGA